MLVAWLAAMLVISVFGLVMTSGSSSDSYLESESDEFESGEELDPPFGFGEKFRDRAEDAASHGAATFLQVEDYEPWAALVINPGDPRGVDVVTVSFEDDTLIIEAEDDNHTNSVSILINKEFADEYLSEAQSDIEIETSDAVNYAGLEESNASAGGGPVYVFQIDHFSTQSIEMFAPPFDPPGRTGEMGTAIAEDAARSGVATFLKVDGYEPWAALVINAGHPDGVDEVTVEFDGETLIIEATDEKEESNSVTILMNKEFADEHLADAEDDLDIETSDAVNYEGLDGSNASAGGRAMYVFQIESFSTQTIEVSAEDRLPFLSSPLLLIAIAVPIAIYALKRRN